MINELPSVSIAVKLPGVPTRVPHQLELVWDRELVVALTSDGDIFFRWHTEFSRPRTQSCITRSGAGDRMFGGIKSGEAE